MTSQNLQTPPVVSHLDAEIESSSHPLGGGGCSCSFLVLLQFNDNKPIKRIRFQFDCRYDTPATVSLELCRALKLPPEDLSPALAALLQTRLEEKGISYRCHTANATH